MEFFAVVIDPESENPALVTEFVDTADVNLR